MALTTGTADRLTSQLYHLPEIVGRLGLSIASAQRAFNADYLDAIKVLIDQILRIQLAGAAGGDGADDRQLIIALLKTLAPARYQFTETTIDFSADLSETFNLAASAGLGVGIGAVTINAGLAIGFGYDYRAAARIRSILHAVPTDADFAGKLLARAEAMDGTHLDLPPRRQVDAAVTNQLSDIVGTITGKSVPKVAEKTTALSIATEKLETAKALLETAKKSQAAFQAAKDDDPKKGDLRKKLVDDIEKATNAATAAKAAADAAAIEKDASAEDVKKAKELSKSAEEAGQAAAALKPA